MSKYLTYLSKDDLISISEEEFNRVAYGENFSFKEIDLDYDKLDNIIKYFGELELKNGKNLGKAIIYIKSGKTMFLADQAKIIEQIAKILKDDADITYGAAIDDNIKGVKVIIMACAS